MEDLKQLQTAEIINLSDYQEQPNTMLENVGAFMEDMNAALATSDSNAVKEVINRKQSEWLAKHRAAEQREQSRSHIKKCLSDLFEEYEASRDSSSLEGLLEFMERKRAERLGRSS